MIRSLQACRAIAALSVVGYHFAADTSQLPEMRRSFLSGLFRHGNIGVDFFFVLSGFIILYAHADDIGRPERLLRYLRNRFLRLYPVYWLYTGIILLAVVLGLSTVRSPNGALGWVTVLGLIRLAPVATPLNVAWTLFYEVAFYAIFATLIVDRRLGLAVFAAWLAAILYVHLGWAPYALAAPWASRICLNFFIGMGACWAHSRLGRRAALAVFAAGVIVILAALLTVDHGVSSLVFGAVIAAGCGLAICGAAALERFKSWNVSILAGIGNASYTLYLVHVHIGSPLLKILARLGALRLMPLDLLFAVLVVVTTGIAYLLYLFIEKPLLDAGRRGFARLGRRPEELRAA
jgi:exopolysaccharide production protein ExoZ